jgi:hypothetical protein
LESRETEMKAKVSELRAWDTSAKAAARSEELRASVVASVLAGLQAAYLSHAEYLAVVGAIHATLAQTAGVQAGVMVTATAVLPVVDLVSSEVHSRSVLAESQEPVLVAESVELMVREASPELWALLHAALVQE